MLDSDPSIDRTGYDPRARPWYKQAINERGLILTKPYVDVAYNVLVVTMAQAVSQGVVGGDLSIASLVESVNRMTLPANGHAIMLHKDGTVIAYKDASKAMKPVSDIDNDLNHNLPQQSRQASTWLPMYFENEGRDKLVWGVDIPNTDWELVIVLDKETLEAPLTNLLLTQLGLSAVMLLLSVLAISWLVNLLLGPLGRVSQALARIADGNGDLTQRIEVDTQDEVGVLADSFNRFVGSQHQLISHIRWVKSPLPSAIRASACDTRPRGPSNRFTNQEIANTLSNSITADSPNWVSSKLVNGASSVSLSSTITNSQSVLGISTPQTNLSRPSFSKYIGSHVLA
jgi:methyl-accepting chemotaxis protein